MKVKRNELKYYINYHDYIALSKALSMFMTKDKYGKKGGYFIRSLYFDTLDNRSFFEKMAGVEIRAKYRLRIYDTQDKKVKFEIKNKLNNYIMKETAWISKKDALAVMDGDVECLKKYKNTTLNKIYCEFKKSKFRKAVLIDYFRDAYVYPMNNIRITFDKLLSKNSAKFDIFQDVKTIPLVNPETIILEIKYNEFIPDWITRLIQTIRFNRSAISKYCISRIGD